MKLLDGPEITTVAEADLQQRREVVYDIRWKRHRDQLLIAVVILVILALLMAALLANPVAALVTLASTGVPALVAHLHTRSSPP